MLRSRRIHVEQGNPIKAAGLCISLAAFAGMLGVTSSANALSNRAWVSSHGADAAGCGAANSPCRSLQYAHDHIVGAGGEIDILDAGSYGPLTITKAISVVNDGGGIVNVEQPAAGGTAIAISAGTNDAVHLRGLNVDGAGSAANGILFKSGQTLDVMRCVFRHFSNAGISLLPGTPANFTISDSIVSDNGGAGLYIEPSGSVKGTIKGVVANNNLLGIAVSGSPAPSSANVFVGAADSVASDNRDGGFVAISQAGQSSPILALNGATAIGNGHYGIMAGTNSKVLLARSMAAGGPIGVTATGTGVIQLLDQSNVDPNGNSLATGNSGAGVPSNPALQAQYAAAAGGHAAAAGLTRQSSPGALTINNSSLGQSTVSGPGGSNGQLQYNNNGSFGGVSGITWNGTTLTANIPIWQDVGTNNIGIGSYSLSSLTTGNQNVFVGPNSGGSNTSGNNNTGVGWEALGQVTTGTFNTAVGSDALAGNTASTNSAFGVDALHTNTTGSPNDAFGVNALLMNTTGSYNVAFGNGALASNVSSSSNSAVGHAALYSSTGEYNSGFGNGAGYNITSGSNNTIIGDETGYGITTGSNNTVIGAKVQGLSKGLSDAVIIATGEGTIRVDYNETAAGAWTFAAPIMTPLFVYATLPSCTALVKGARSMITDGSAPPTFAAVAAGGGSLMTPVYCDGITWRNG